MWIERDISQFFINYSGLEAAVLLGPRQVGKSSLLTKIQADPRAFVALDDLQLRSIAQRDPALLLLNKPSPTIIEEFQYAPDLLPQIKLLIDRERRSEEVVDGEKIGVKYLLSGSNQIEVEKALRESLAGRATFFSLHGLSVHEILRHRRDIAIEEILFRGGFPDLYRRMEIDPIAYLNDYISTFVEKDIARSAGVTKLNEFMTVTKLAAARVGNLIDYSSLGNDAGVASKTVSEWIALLERARIVTLLRPYSSNLNSRLIKSPKIYFLDPGLVTRLQGHQFRDSIIASPQAGAIFENLVVSEIIKVRDHFRLDLQMWFWRTKSGEELDIIVQLGEKRIFIEVKLAIQGVTPVRAPRSVQKEFPTISPIWIVSIGGENQRLSEECYQVPISMLTERLLGYFTGETSSDKGQERN